MADTTYPTWTIKNKDGNTWNYTGTEASAKALSSATGATYYSSAGKTIQYDPNTGQKLSAGQTVVDKNTGQTLTQGTQWKPASTNNASTLTSSPVPNLSNITPIISNTTSPVSTGSASYVIKSGDTLSAIAQRNGTTVSALMQANPNITDANKIYAGQSLNIPTSISTNAGTGTPVQGSQSVTEASGAGASVQTEDQKKADLATVLSEVQNRINAGTMSETSLTPEVASLIKQGQQSNTVTGSSDADYYANLLEQNKEEMAKISNPTTGSTGYQALIDMINQQASFEIGTVRAEAEAKYGTEALREQVATQTQKVQAIQAEIGQLQAEQASEVENARNRLSSMESISADINEINYRYGLQISKKNALMASEAALAQVYQGNYAEANNLVAQAVGDYTAEYQAEVDKFDKLYSVYGSWIGDLNQEERQILESAHQASKEKLAEAKAAATQIMEMKLQYAGAGINISDTLQEAVAKAEKYIVAEEIRAGNQVNTQVIGSADNGYVLINSDTGEIIRQITQGKAPEEEFNIADSFSEIIYSQLEAGASPERAAQEALAYAESKGLSLKGTDLELFRLRAEEISAERKRVEEEEKGKAEEVSAIEQEISELKKSNILTDWDIQYALKNRGYSDLEIANSSVGGFLEKAGAVVSNFFKNLF